MCRMRLGLKSITARIVFSVRCAAMRDARCVLSSNVKKVRDGVVRRRNNKKDLPRRHEDHEGHKEKNLATDFADLK